MSKEARPVVVGAVTIVLLLLALASYFLRTDPLDDVARLWHSIPTSRIAGGVLAAAVLGALFQATIGERQRQELDDRQNARRAAAPRPPYPPSSEDL